MVASALPVEMQQVEQMAAKAAALAGVAVDTVVQANLPICIPAVAVAVYFPAPVVLVALLVVVLVVAQMPVGAIAPLQLVHAAVVAAAGGRQAALALLEIMPVEQVAKQSRLMDTLLLGQAVIQLVFMGLYHENCKFRSN